MITTYSCSAIAQLASRIATQRPVAYTRLTFSVRRSGAGIAAILAILLERPQVESGRSRGTSGQPLFVHVAPLMAELACRMRWCFLLSWVRRNMATVKSSLSSEVQICLPETTNLA
jgi:hypothetical protein